MRKKIWTKKNHNLEEKARLKLIMKNVGMKDGWSYWEMVSTDTGAHEIKIGL